ncbi:MAG: UDP-glucose 6-dehydrogenase, partial [Alphaproteobacteria bacterium]
ARRVLSQDLGDALSGVTFADSPETAAQGADALAIVTEWKVFRSPDLPGLARMLKGKVIFDGRNLYEPSVVEDAGLAYFPIGRRQVSVGADQL